MSDDSFEMIENLIDELKDNNKKKSCKNLNLNSLKKDKIPKITITRIVDSNKLKNILFPDNNNKVTENNHLNLFNCFYKNSTAKKLNKTPKNIKKQDSISTKKSIKKTNTFNNIKEEINDKNELININNNNKNSSKLLKQNKEHKNKKDNSLKLNNNIENPKEFILDTKEHKNKVIIKSANLKDISKIDFSEKKKINDNIPKIIEKHKKEEENKYKSKIKLDDKKIKEEEVNKNDNHLKLKDNFYNEDGNISPSKKRNKKKKNNYLSSCNVPKIEIEKNIYNDENNMNNITKNKKNRQKTNKNLNIKHFHFDFDKELKSKYNNKNSMRFISSLSLEKNILLDSKLNQKSTNQNDNFNVLDKQDNNEINTNSTNSDNNKKEILDSSNISDKNKHKKENVKYFKNRKSINSYKGGSNRFNLNNTNSIRHNHLKIRNLNTFKKNILTSTNYEIKHINNIYLGRNQIKPLEKKINFIKVPYFSVVKPDNLVSFEYNRAYENNNRNYYLNKNNEKLLQEAMKERKYSKNVKSSDNNGKKKNKSIFCCL